MGLPRLSKHLELETNRVRHFSYLHRITIILTPK